MDGGERERDGTERIKQTVKEVVSRKAALQATLRRQKRKRDHGYAVAEEESSTSPLGEKIPPGARMSEDGDLEEYMPGLTPDVSSQSVQSPETITVISRAAPPQKPKEAASLGPSTIHDIAYLNLPFLEEEAEAEAGGRSTPPRVLADHRVRLLMHFLDHVFPIEFPFYNPSIFEGGRGWLLSLLMRTRPLYHAALSVSAYHHSALNTARNLKCKIQTWNELQIHHTLALKELHDVMLDIDRGGQDEKGNIDFRIDALASIVQMIAFEVCLLSYITLRVKGVMLIQNKAIRRRCRDLENPPPSRHGPLHSPSRPGRDVPRDLAGYNIVQRYNLVRRFSEPQSVQPEHACSVIPLRRARLVRHLGLCIYWLETYSARVPHPSVDRTNRATDQAERGHGL